MVSKIAAIIALGLIVTFVIVGKKPIIDPAVKEAKKIFGDIKIAAAKVDSGKTG